MSRLALVNLTKHFPAPNGQRVRAVEGLSLTVAEGELVTLVGPSGCGKTTTLRLIAGLETPASGDVVIDGQAVTALEPKARDVGMVFQRHALLPHLSAAENLGLGLRLRRVPKAEIAARINDLAAKLGILDCLSRKPGELSGGQCQRVALGRALIRRPRLLLLDEPFANLDAPLRRELRQELLRVHREHKLTTLLVTHDQAEALALGHRVAVMNSGRIEQVGEPNAVRQNPATTFVREFLSPEVI